MTAYNHGIRELGYKGGTPRPSGDVLSNNDMFIADVDRRFWSASSRSNNTSNAWVVFLNDGNTLANLKTNTAYRLLCVAP